MCQKIPYNSRKEAAKDAKIIEANARFCSRRTKRHPRGGLVSNLEPYECYCGKWHLTSKLK